MGLIWWIMPAIAGVVGLMLLFAGFGKLAKLKPLSGLPRVAFGVGFLGLAGVVAFAGLNLQTYQRLTLERDVATIKFSAVEGMEETYEVDVLFAGGDRLELPDGTKPYLKGDQFEIGAQIIKFKPMANMLGYNSIYRLEFIEARKARRYSKESVTEATSNGLSLATYVGLDVHGLAEKRGAQFGVDAEYGSATYQPMGDGFEYRVNITQDALIARPTEATKALISRGSYPGFKPVPNEARP